MKKRVFAGLLAAMISIASLNMTSVEALAAESEDEIAVEEQEESEEISIEEDVCTEDADIFEEDEIEEETEITIDEEIENFESDGEEINEFVEETEELFNEFNMDLSADIEMFNAGNGSGYSATNAVDMTLGTKYSRTWTSSTYSYDSYYIFTMPYDGYIDIYIDKPQASSGAYANEYVYLYDASGNEVWNNYTKYFSSTTGYADFKIGIPKGTYYINLDPAFKVTSGKLTGGVTVTAKEDATCETEPNGTEASADQINLNTEYNFYYGSRGDKIDTFAVNLTGGKAATILMGGDYTKVSNTTAILHLIKPNGDYNTILSQFSYDAASGKYVYKFTPATSGKYYIELSNFTGRENNGCFELSLQVNQEGATDTYTGFRQVNGTWCYFKNGSVDTSFTGMAQYGGTWYYVESGKITWNYNGLIQYGGTWYYITNSVLKWGVSGVTRYGNNYYYVNNSQITWKDTGIAAYSGGYYYFQNSQYNPNYSGLAQYGKDWYYISNGVLKWGINTCAQYGGNWYVVRNSKVDFSFTGTTVYGGKEYRVINGVVQL